MFQQMIYCNNFLMNSLVRSHEGSGLTIRIPRQLSDKGLPTSSQPLMSPTHDHSQARIVGKSKSLTTSMDKLSTALHRPPSRNSSSRESSIVGSRGSTPSSTRSTVISRPPSRRSVQSIRSPRTPDRSTPEQDDRAGKTDSPTGSEVSVHSTHSVNSSTHSVNSSKSVHSLASSNASVKSRASTHSCASGRSESRGPVRASSEPPTGTSSSRTTAKRLSKTGSPVPTNDTVTNSKQTQQISLRRSSASASSLNSTNGDNGLDDNTSRTMSRKSTPSRQTPPRTPNAGNQRHSIGSTPNRKTLPVFNSYMSLFQVQEKLKKGEVIEGVLRINPKNYEDAYISAPDGVMDIFIGGVRDRNASLHGDIVAALINPQDKWKVLYDQLDIHLEEHRDLKALVYMPTEPIIPSTDNAFIYSIDNAAENLHTNLGKSHITHNSISEKLEERDSDVVIEEETIKEDNQDELKECHESKKKKKKRGGRGKKRNRIKVVDALKSSLNIAQDSQTKIEKINTTCPPLFQGDKDIQDNRLEVSCPSQNLNCGGEIVCENQSTSNNQITSIPSSSKKIVVVVPPDQLSECELTDDGKESEDSLILDDHFSGGFHCQRVVTAGTAITLKPDCDYDYDSKKSSFCSKKCHGKLVEEIDQKIKELKLEEFCPNENVKREETQKSNNSTKSAYNKQSDSKKNTYSKANKSNIVDKPTLKTETSNQIGKEVTKPSIMQVLRLPNWEKFVQRTATVVYILERKHSRMAAGILKPFADGNPHMALFSPFDSRVPRIKIQIANGPPDFLTKPEEYAKLMLIARITEWNEPRFAFGELVRDIGKIGDIEAETIAVLLENGVDYSEFPEVINDDLPTRPWTIPTEEISKRSDLRNSLIFTIDPSTARDLDDAVSCLVLPSGNFRVGVHIADVTYFVNADSHLDAIASERATSVYLVDRVIPMLPRPLCEDLCSLVPGQDRLAFSVIWELTPAGKIEGEWFGRTVIRSCAKLSYDHAQTIIETPLNDLTEEQFPEISDGHTLTSISEAIINLNEIAVCLRQKRINDGALRLDQMKLCFSLDVQSKTPNGIFVYEQRDSNKLIEEFMLLANIAVAHKIYKHFPNRSLLRHHPPPHAAPLENTIKFLTQNGIVLDPSSSGTLNESIQKYVGNDIKSLAKMQLIVNLCSKPMQFARYFCTGVVKKEELFHHYALNVPYYTHFTSPIRRYADMIVHRVLAATIYPENYPFPKWNEFDIQKKASLCNDRKQAAKIVQELSTELYLALFIRSVGELVEDSIVIGVLDRSVDVLIMKLGIIKRCYTDKLPLKSVYSMQEQQRNVLLIEWNEDKEANLPVLCQKLTYFDSVTVILRPYDNDALKFNAFLVRPDSGLKKCQ